MIVFWFRHRETGEERSMGASTLEHAQEHYPVNRGWEPFDPRAPKPKMKMVISGGQVRKVPIE